MATVSTTLPSDGQTIDAADVNTPINAILSEFNGNIDNDNIKTGANISGSKLADTSISPSKLDATLAGGWITGTLPAVSSVTALGNRSYTVAFASDVASTLSEGMRLRTTRTVASTQNAFSLDGSNDYYNKTSPSGLSFTTTFTCSAWIYVTSYALGGIIARRNADTEGWSMSVLADGRVELLGLRIAANNKYIRSYQSIPLNRWVHVAATMDMAAGDTTAQKIWIDGVEVPRSYTLNGTATALVQGTTALVVGAEKSAGTSPFPGYIDQAAVFSSQLSDATIKAMINQGLTGSETGLVSAFSNGSTTDLNTTNANNLTAQNGATTVASAPWGNRGLSTTLDYGLVMAVSTTDVTVQVPEGCTIPTTGGVSAVAYSTQANPYGWVSYKGRWFCEAHFRNNSAQSSPVQNTWYNFGTSIVVPIGAFTIESDFSVSGVRATAGGLNVENTLSTTNNGNTEAEANRQSSSYAQAAGNFYVNGQNAVTLYRKLDTETTYYFNIRTTSTSVSSVSINPDSNKSYMRIIPSGL